MNIAEFKKVIENKEVIFGSKNTLKLLRNNKLSSIYLSSDCDNNTEKEIKNMADISGISIIETGKTKEEIKFLCKKPFNISVIGVKNA